VSDRAASRGSQPAVHPLADPQFCRLLESLPIAAYTCDADGLIRYFNQQAVEVWGRVPELNSPVDRFCGSFKLLRIDGSPITHDRCWMAIALKTGNPFNGEEIVIEREDGARRTVLAHANPVRNEAGTLVGAINLLVDVTEREDGARAQRLLAAIVESSDDAIISKTLDGTIATWNHAAERLFGWTAQEAIGSSIMRIIPPDRQEEESEILVRLRQGERIDHYETLRVAKDGRLIDVSLTISPLRDAKGRITGASKVARDITAGKEIQRAFLDARFELENQFADLAALHEMSLQLSTTLELQPTLNAILKMAVTLDDSDFGLLLLRGENQELSVGASHGFDEGSLEFIAGAPFGACGYGTAVAERRRVIVEDAETDPLFAPDRPAVRQAGFRALHCVPLIARSGQVIGVLATHHRQPHRPTDWGIRLIDLCARQAVDVIENAQLYQELREVDRKKDEFLATLAHELRTPLAPISNSLQILRLTDDLSPAIERIRDVLERQVDHMVRLVDDLLEVSRITRGKVQLRKEPRELAEVVANAVEAGRPMIDAAEHQLAITLPSEPVIVDVDAVRLAQVIANLLINAAKYTESGGQIWLNVRKEAGEAVISVRDNGLGIPPEVLPRVFELFSQADQILNRSQGGLGIGLTLAKGVVELHGGRIEAFSAGRRAGSEFVVHLPVTSSVRPSLPQASLSTRLRSRHRTLHILVVDDTQAAAFMLEKLLRTLGHDVVGVHSGPSALASLQVRVPDLVISDIGMPGMDGHQLATRIREDSRFDRVFLVALTGYGQENDRLRALEAGFDRHLVKPAGLDALEELLESVCERQAAESSIKQTP